MQDFHKGLVFFSSLLVRAKFRAKASGYMVQGCGCALLRVKV